jgi:hypothetical protein
MKNFADVKNKFLAEFEKETSELGEKWREVFIKKIIIVFIFILLLTNQIYNKK